MSRNLTLEIFETLNHFNTEYMKEIFYKTTNLLHRRFNPKFKKATTRSLKIILINGLVQNVNAIYVLISTKNLKLVQDNFGFDPFSSEAVFVFLC